MNIATRLHWFQGTGTKDMRPSLPWKFTSCNGWGNYPQAWETDFGLKVGTNRNSPRQGWHIIARGKQMEDMQASGLDDNMWLSMIMPHLRKVARMDVAVDIQVEIDWGIFEVGNEKIKTRLSMDSKVIGQARKGNTQYFGAPTGDLRIRIYDKASELKTLLGALTRVEAQTRDAYATQLAKDMRYQKDVASVGRAYLWRKLKIDEEWYTAIRDGTEDATLTKIARPDANYWGWLSQVLASIEGNLRTGENLAEIEEFHTRLNRTVDEYLRWQRLVVSGKPDIGTSGNGT